MELWEILPEFANVTASYQKFVDAVYKLYPGSDAERCWSIGDMEKLVGEASRVGISSLADLGKYHREFITMTTFLIAKNCISAAEQSRAFAHGFPQKLWTKVAHQLQLKFPNHFPDDPYNLEQIHDAVLMSLLIRYAHIPFYFHFSFTFSTSSIYHYAPLLQRDHMTIALTLSD